MVMFSSLLQYINAASPIYVTESGIITFVKPILPGFGGFPIIDKIKIVRNNFREHGFQYLPLFHVENILNLGNSIMPFATGFSD